MLLSTIFGLWILSAITSFRLAFAAQADNITSTYVELESTTKYEAYSTSVSSTAPQDTFNFDYPRVLNLSSWLEKQRLEEMVPLDQRWPAQGCDAVPPDTLTDRYDHDALFHSYEKHVKALDNVKAVTSAFPSYYSNCSAAYDNIVHDENGQKMLKNFAIATGQSFESASEWFLLQVSKDRGLNSTGFWRWIKSGLVKERRHLLEKGLASFNSAHTNSKFIQDLLDQYQESIRTTFSECDRDYNAAKSVAISSWMVWTEEPQIPPEATTVTTQTSTVMALRGMIDALAVQDLRTCQIMKAAHAAAKALHSDDQPLLNLKALLEQVVM